MWSYRRTPMSTKSCLPTLVAFLSLGSGCQRHIGAQQPVTISVVVPRDTIVATLGSGAGTNWVTFQLPFIVHNPGPASVYLFDYHLEKLVTGTWSRAYDALFFHENGGPEIHPTDSLRVDWDVWAQLGGSGAPQWLVGPIGGTYRIVARFRNSNSATSTTFVVVRPK